MEIQIKNKPSYRMAPGIGIQQNYDTVEFIKSRVSEFFGIPKEEIYIKRRFRHIVWPRQITARLIREHTSLSLEKIGREIGGHDHATVKHAITTVGNIISIDKKEARNYEIINQFIVNAANDTFHSIIKVISDEFEIEPALFISTPATMDRKVYKAYCASVWVLQSVQKISNKQLAALLSVSPMRVERFLADKHQFTRTDPAYHLRIMQVRNQVAVIYSSLTLANSEV